MTQPWFYPDCVSAEAGEDVTIFASSALSPCTLKVSRVGRKTETVAQFEGIQVGEHAVPDDADSLGCGWPGVMRFTVADEWRSGYYDLELTAPDGSSTHHFIIVRKAKTARKAKAVLVISTGTYFAYNYWGGANAYAHVDDLMAGKVTPDESRFGAIGVLSRMRPLAQGQFAPPDGVSRLINYSVRGPGEMPIPGDMKWAMEHKPSPYDGSAGFLQKWENEFAAWSEANGYDLDYLTDHDFERDESILSDYKAVFVVGHSEYWSGKQRFAVEDYVQSGGNLAVFSGNTCYWKVRWEDNGQTLIAHKWRGEEDDPLWGDPATRKEATHLWSHEAFGAPEAALTGLSFLYGGYHRLCMCAARGSAAYTVYDDLHWALEGSDLYYGDQIGTSVPLIGYENDGCPIRFGDDGLPAANGGLGVPQDLKIIAIAPATLAEDPRSPFPSMIPREMPEVLARLAYGEANESSISRLMKGHAVLASFKNGDGEVFNSGTTEWAHGLAAGDPFVETITHNVFKRFGVERGSA